MLRALLAVAAALLGTGCDALLAQHDALHELETRTYALEQSCERG